MTSRLAFPALLLLLAASPAWADSELGSAGEPPRAAAAAPPAAKTNTFDALSAGDRKTARALFLAQHPTQSGPAPLSLNQIAELKAGDSWAQVFKLMQTRGLIQAKATLGQVIGGYEHQRRSERGAPSGRGGRAALVTNGHGEVVASTRNRAGVAHAGDEVAQTRTTALAAASDRGERAERPERPERHR